MQKEQIIQLVNKTIDKNDTVQGLVQDVTVLKQDVAVLKQDVALLKQDVSELKTDMTNLKHEVHRQGLIQEDMQKDVKTILQAVTPLIQKCEKIDPLKEQTQAQKEELSVVKEAVRLHITDTNIHQTA